MQDQDRAFNSCGSTFTNRFNQIYMREDPGPDTTGSESNSSATIFYPLQAEFSCWQTALKLSVIFTLTPSPPFLLNEQNLKQGRAPFGAVR